MSVWLDDQLSPGLAIWVSRQFDLIAQSVRDLGLRSAPDPEIYFAARQANAIVITKDHDFVRLLERNGPPPEVSWITCGNTSNARMKQVLTAELSRALALLGEGEFLAEISDAR